MKLCLSCFHIWPSEAVYCGHCKKSLGTRVCDKGHSSPLSSRICTMCSSHKLSQGAYVLPLGFVNIGLARLVGVLIVIWCISHFGALISFLLARLDFLYRPIAGEHLQVSVQRTLGTIFSVGVFIFTFHLLMGDRAKAVTPIYKAILKVFGHALKFAGKAISALFAAIEGKGNKK